MKNKLTANMGLKLISLLFAFVLWLVVNNMENPTITETYVNVPVKLLNTDLITDAGKVYEILDGTDVVERVSVKAPKSVHSALNAGNITATADINDLSSLDTISIKFSSSIYGDDIESIKGSIDTVKLNIENKKSKTLALKANVAGEVASGYIVGEVTTDQNLIRISGPESVIDQVSKAMVEVDVTGFTNDIGTNLDIRLYDADEHLIQSSRISQNIRSVGVNVSIYQTAEVPVHYNVSGTPADGYRIAQTPSGSVETVLIAGKSNVIRNIAMIEVPAEAVDVTGQTGDYVVELNLKEYLPDNVHLADASLAKTEVTVMIRQETSREVDIPGTAIEVTNVPEGFRASIEEFEEDIAVTLIGLPSDLSAVRVNEIKGTVDVQKWMEEEGMEEATDGYYYVEVDFGLGEDVEMAQPLTILMHLSEIAE
ncbi:MAG: hypothetical protein IJO65_02210 [Lachnospiraceae bacterium]|nr:hypothetical protein [Lachnospiraceae bacterium]